MIYERYVFGTCSQKPGQTIDEYVAELRKLAATCEYGQLKDELLRDRIVLGTSDAVTRAHMLREKKLTLDTAIDMLRSNEITRRQLSRL